MCVTSTANVVRCKEKSSKLFGSESGTYIAHLITCNTFFFFGGNSFLSFRWFPTFDSPSGSPFASPLTSWFKLECWRQLGNLSYVCFLPYVNHFCTEIYIKFCCLLSGRYLNNVLSLLLVFSVNETIATFSYITQTSTRGQNISCGYVVGRKMWRCALLTISNGW